MQLAILYASTAVVFLALDALMLIFVMKPLFTRHLGDQMLDGFRAGPAASFYAAYIAGLIYLVSWEGLKQGAPRRFRPWRRLRVRPGCAPAADRSGRMCGPKA